MTQHPRLVPVRELARYLSCSSRTVRREIAKGVIPAVMVSNGYRVSIEEAVRALKVQQSK